MTFHAKLDRNIATVIVARYSPLKVSIILPSSQIPIHIGCVSWHLLRESHGQLFNETSADDVVACIRQEVPPQEKLIKKGLTSRINHSNTAVITCPFTAQITRTCGGRMSYMVTIRKPAMSGVVRDDRLYI